jgi:CelD/BcsL family acetyltransferase involved in cellulose biosynthesis
MIETRPIRPGHWAEDEGRWAALFAAAPHASPYLAPGWVRTFVETFADELPTTQLVVRSGQDVVEGMCLFTHRVDHRALVPLRRWYLNTAGERGVDSVVVEHNAILSAWGSEARVYAEIAEFLERAPLDELVLLGATEDAVLRFCEALPLWRPQIEWRESPYVDLEAIRASGGDHLAAVSRNTREQIRRSLRQYRESGTLRVDEAGSVNEALAMFDEMVVLHQARWQRLGQSGGFATDVRRKFHRNFVRRAHADGHVLFLRVVDGEGTLGVLYNLVANGHVCFYQSGLRYGTDSRLKPGLVAHHLAIAHCLTSGHRQYDFLPSAPSEGRYKLSLATDSYRLGTVILQRPGWRRRWFEWARTIRRGLSAGRLNMDVRVGRGPSSTVSS